MKNITKNIQNAVKWIENNSTNEYIYTHSNMPIPYNEVNGYFIPTLLNYGMKDRAKCIAKYLSLNQKSDGSWNCHGKFGQNTSFIFDTPQIIDGLCEFGETYSVNIKNAVKWTKNNMETAKYTHRDIKTHINPRILYCIKKAGYDISDMSDYLNDKSIYVFDVMSHFYSYGFEGCARLGIDCSPYIQVAKKYNGLIPQKDGSKEYCFTALSQFSLSLFICDEYDLGINALDFVSSFQNESGGFYGSNGDYFSHDEISWAVKFYMDAISEAQKCWFKKNFKIFSSELEFGLNDKRFMFVKDNIKENDKVLEVGSGKGRYINNIKNCQKFACDIIDTSKYLDASFSIGSALRIPHNDETFDVVFYCESMEHSLLPYKAIDEGLRVLKKGGKLIIVDKDVKDQNFEIHFCEQWLDFSKIEEKYGATISVLSQNGIKIPFYGAIITK